MRAKDGRAPLIVTGAALALLLTGCSSDTGPNAGPESERAAADAYIAALNAKDTQALRALAPPGNDAAAEATDRVDRLGGRGLRLQNVEVQHDFGPDVASALLVTTAADGSAGEERIVLTRIDGRWYITLGQNPEGANDKTPASTQKPTP
ncbi:hypothetical protein [Streptomyces sp. Isolate_45]|uniref:hypothetical protein n=1 Tax=Streptomyces sp. Isolate_45 TaxID=2950111 RepID=UPI002481EC33|nr:hypothetical protein [Streptomyces sp. Isolate_45]MDA5281212.1 hypothetical protein [Streptomyces sp. Isolate_45]